MPLFTMGARPVFSLDSLRFGPIHGDTAQHCRSRFAGVAGGIAHCGNCIGVPAIGGEVQVFFRGKMNGSARAAVPVECQPPSVIAGAGTGLSPASSPHEAPSLFQNPQGSARAASCRV